MLKRLCSIICAAALAFEGAGVFAAEDEAPIKYSYKLSMESDSDFKSVYTYTGGTLSISKSYVSGKFGNAIQFTNPGHYISNAGNRYNGCVMQFKTDELDVGNEKLTMLDIMRDTQNISMWVHTPKTVDHGNGAAESRTLEFIFEYSKTSGNAKFSKKIQLPNTGDWAYITIPVSDFKSGSLSMDTEIQSEDFTAITQMTVSFPYKDYFGANPDESTLESPWEEPLKIDELLFDRSTEEVHAIIPPSTGEEAYVENADITGISVNGVPVSGFDPSAASNTVAVPSYYDAEQIKQNVTVEVKTPYIEKTNVNQATEGATYEISAPSSVPGKGVITVYSGNRRIHKTYNIDFVARSGIQPDLSGMTVNGGEITLPVVNESSSGSQEVCALAVVKNADGICTDADIAEGVMISVGGSTELKFSVEGSGEVYIYIFDNETNYTLLCPPVKGDKTIGSYTAPSGTISEFNYEVNGSEITISGSVTGSGTMLALLKNESGYIGAYTFDVSEGTFSNVLKHGGVYGDAELYISYGGTLRRDIYIASEDETAACIEEYMALGDDAQACGEYYEKYKKVLNLDNSLSAQLSADEIAGAVLSADKTAGTVDAVRAEIGAGIVLAVSNKSNSADALKEIYTDYNDLAGFDSSAAYFVKYINGTDNLDKVLEATAAEDYDDIDGLRTAFRENGLLYALASVSGYGEIGTLISDNRELLEDHLDYGSLASMSDTRLSGFYQYLAKQDIKSLDELDEMLEEYISSGSQSDTGSVSGNNGNTGNSGGGFVSLPSNNGAVSGETPAAEPEDSGFTDVDSSHWAYSSIMGLKKLNITDGREDGSFGVNDFVTREEFVKLLLGTFGIEPEESEGKFEDVDDTQWYAPYVNTAAEMGLVSGISETEFGTGRSITRQDICTLIARALERKGINITASSFGDKFADDGDIADYAADAVMALRSIGIVSGKGDNMFMPQAEATRAETAKMLYSVYTYVESAGSDDVDISGDDRFSTLARKFLALGMIDRPVSAQTAVTRGMFAQYAAMFMNAGDYSYNDGKYIFDDVPADHKCYAAIRYLYENSFIDTTKSTYGPDEPITLGEAAVIICRITGYEAYAQQRGGDYSAYYTVATTNELIPALGKSTSDTLEFTDVLEILDTASEASMVMSNMSGNGTSYENSDVTPLYYYHKILVLEDILSAFGTYTSDGGDTTSSGGVRIGNDTFITDIVDAYKYLGCRVDAYYVENTDELVFIEQNERNETFVIDGSLIESYDGTAITYRRDENTTATKRETLSKSMSRMYNYNYTAEYTKDDVENAEEIIFIDNNGDGSYDVINVINEDVYCVSSISSEDKVIYDYFGSEPMRTSDMDSVTVYDENGAAVSVSAVSTYDILSVIKDKQGRNVIMYVSRNEISGVVESVWTDKTKNVTIDGADYELTESLSSFPAAEGILTPGNGVSALLDRRGRVAYAELNNDLEANTYAYLIKAISKTYETEPYIKAYIPGEGIQDIVLAENAQINGQKVTEGLDLERLFRLANLNTECYNQLISYKLNDNGQIQSIRTAQYVSGEELYTSNSSFTRSSDLEDAYYNATYKNFPGLARVNEATIILNVPESSSLMQNSSNYGVVDTKDFKSATFDTVEVYNMSRDMTAGIIVLRSDSGGGTQLTYSTPIAVIKDISETFIDSEIRASLTVLYNGAEYEYVLAKGVDLVRQYKGTDGSAVTSVLGKGDVIRFALNSNDEITDYHKVFDFDNQDDPNVVIRGNELVDRKSYIGSSKTMIAFNGNAEDPDTDVISGRIWQGKNPYWFTGVQYSAEFGIVKSIHGTTMIIQTYPGTEGSNSTQCERYFNLKNDRVYIADSGAEGIRLGSVDDIVPSELAGEAAATRIIISRHNDVPSAAVIIKR